MFLKMDTTCSICLGFFSNPISLSCTHIFCFNCANNWMIKNEGFLLICPICREENKTPVKEEWQIRELTRLIRQHCSRMEQSLHWSSKFLRWLQKDMTLDTATANSFLVLSNDLRSVWCGKICHNLVEHSRFTYMVGILGSLRFYFGCHYWEVDVGKGNGWTLGICKESAFRRRNTCLSCENGFWVISMKAGAIHANSNPERIPARPGLHLVGIFLDVDMEEVKFFDIISNALIYKYNSLSISFLDPLRPFFCPELPANGDSGAPLSICPQGIQPELSELNETLDLKKDLNDQGKDNTL